MNQKSVLYTIDEFFCNAPERPKFQGKINKLHKLIVYVTIHSNKIASN